MIALEKMKGNMTDEQKRDLDYQAFNDWRARSIANFNNITPVAQQQFGVSQNTT